MLLLSDGGQHGRHPQRFGDAMGFYQIEGRRRVEGAQGDLASTIPDGAKNAV